MKYLLFLYLFVAISSCANSGKLDSHNKSVLLLDFDKASVRDSIYASTFIASVTPVVLETTDENLIGFLSAMQTTSNSICILDGGPGGSGCLFVFDKSGKYLRKIGKKGQGPGEYIGIHDFTINEDSDEIFISDKDASKLRVYRFSTGEFIRDISFEDENVEYASVQYSNGKLFADLVPFSQTKEGPMIHVLNTIGHIEYKCLDIEVHNHGWLRPFFLGESFFYCKNSKKPKYTHYFMDTVMSINNGVLEPYLVIKSEDWVKSADVKNNKNNSQDAEEDAYFKIQELPIAFNVQSYVESDDYIYFLYRKKRKTINVIYDKKQELVLRSKVLLDDIMFDRGRARMPLIGCGDDNGMYGYINTASVPSFNEYIVSGLSSGLKPDLRDFFKKNVTSDSNPIILYYEYK